jgi:hypothetical protein
MSKKASCGCRYFTEVNCQILNILGSTAPL